MRPTPLDKKPKQFTPDRMFWWISLIAATATSILVGAFFFYWIYFGGNAPSNNPNDWGPFGDFIGGVTNPIISFFALLSLLLTLVMQSKQLDATREQLQHTEETTSRQFVHMENEAKKTAITRTLQVLEDRLERLYREPVYFVSEGILEQWELYLLLNHATPNILQKVPTHTDLGPPQYRNEYLRTKATLTQLHFTLVKLSAQLTELVRVDVNDGVSLFYEPTLLHLTQKLKEIGYMPSPDDQIIEGHQVIRDSLRKSHQST